MHPRLNVTYWPVEDKNSKLEILRQWRRPEKMNAIEKNDSSNMSAQGRTAINLHKRRGSDVEIQSEDVQEEEKEHHRGQNLSPQLSMSPAFTDKTDFII